MADKFSAVAPKVRLYVDGREFDKIYYVERVNVSTGGKPLASAQVRAILDTPTTNIRLALSSSEFEITVTDPNGGAKENVIFWGKPSGQVIDASDSEGRVLEVSQCPHHFGTYVDGMIEHNIKTGKHETLRQPIVFNPTIDFTSYSGRRIPNLDGAGLVRGNMTDAHPYRGGNCNTFLDPASVFTATARRFAIASSEKSGEDPDESKIQASDKKWTLSEAVSYLCYTLNQRAEYFANPGRDELKLLDESTALLHDVVIPLGTYLPEALDLVLNPFGFGWYVDYEARGIRRIKVFRRGDGTKRKAKLQKPREDFDPKKTTVSACELAYGNTALVNRIHAVGDFKLFESTFELQKAWEPTLDTLTDDQLSDSAEDWLEHPERHRVYRDYVLNEAGDYNRLRPEIRTPFDFKPIFGIDAMPRRRRFHPCITLDKDRLPVGANGYLVEYYDGFEWRAIGGFDILANECGVRFGGPTPPAELSVADTVKVRITASVYSDERLEYHSDRSAKSTQGDEVTALLDVGNKFHLRKIAETSQFFDMVKARTYEHSQVDDEKRIKDFADTLTKSLDQLDARASIVVPNLNSETFELGDVVTKLEGREFDFDIGSIAGNRYPQITGITYDCLQHRRIVALESFRDTSYR